ncbi:hypothetical protein FGD71_010280 [Streptomyces sporangiiformans]|uniref:Uncharacterized protein n=1 Tax=Streptomyces sporangiiformans TaxID=2315329 RepID=A0A505DMJ2_9ACTN|nr:hypothetical protein FGD71_010280 [Streptomyces sporangiiformans]
MPDGHRVRGHDEQGGSSELTYISGIARKYVQITAHIRFVTGRTPRARRTHSTALGRGGPERGRTGTRRTCARTDAPSRAPQGARGTARPATTSPHAPPTPPHTPRNPHPSGAPTLRRPCPSP